MARISQVFFSVLPKRDNRVVHGGETFASSVKIDDKVMAALEECIPLAPLHNPANITGIRWTSRCPGGRR